MIALSKLSLIIFVVVGFSSVAAIAQTTYPVTGGLSVSSQNGGVGVGFYDAFIAPDSNGEITYANAEILDGQAFFSLVPDGLIADDCRNTFVSVTKNRSCRIYVSYRPSFDNQRAYGVIKILFYRTGTSVLGNPIKFREVFLRLDGEAVSQRPDVYADIELSGMTIEQPKGNVITAGDDGLFSLVKNQKVYVTVNARLLRGAQSSFRSSVTLYAGFHTSIGSGYNSGIVWDQEIATSNSFSRTFEIDTGDGKLPGRLEAWQRQYTADANGLNDRKVVFFRSTDNIPKVEIKGLRLGQSVFEPTTNDSGTAFVSNKPYLAEVSIKAAVGSQGVAFARLYDNDMFVAESKAFDLSEIVEFEKKAYIFGKPLPVGEHNLRIEITRQSLTPQVLASQKRSVFVYATSLSLLLSRITAPCTTPACPSVTPSDVDHLEKIQIPLAQNTLPISGSGITYSWGTDTPRELDSYGVPLYMISAAKLWIAKKLAFKGAAVGLVARGQLELDGKRGAMGLMFRSNPNVVFATSSSPAILGHELLHSLGAEHATEGNDYLFVERAGFSPLEVSATGQPLDSAFIKINLWPPSLHGAATEASSFANYGIDRASYNQALKRLTTAPIDPKVLLVAGALDSYGRSVYSEVISGEANLDEELPLANTVIRGLDQDGNEISRVSAFASNKEEIFNEDGSFSIQESPFTSFVGTLADPNSSIAKIEVIVNGQIVFSRNKIELSLKSIVMGLNGTAFKTPMTSLLLVAKSRLLFASYEKHRAKNKRLAAVELNALKFLWRLDMKQNFKLNDQTLIQLTDALKMIEIEMQELR